MTLDTEARFFDSVREDLAPEHSGQFALVKGAALEGLFTTFAEAYAAGVRAHGLEPFMVRQVAASDPGVSLPALTAGVLFAL